MNTLTEHPMDCIKVRPLQFDFEKLPTQNLVWSKSHPRFAMFLNAIGVHIPYFEKYLIVALRQAKAEISDERLLRDISRIIGQEAHHARQFVHWNHVMAGKYPEVARFDSEAREYFSQHSKSDSLKQLVGFTAGYETFTFLAGMIVLDHYDRWMGDSDPVLKAMWVWHQVEEVEHGAVAFDVYKKLYGDDELYRKWMIVRALVHIAVETTKTYAHMARVEGWLSNPFKALSRMGFCITMLVRFLICALPVFSKHYDPRRHPLVTNKQNPVQIAWRRYEHNGGEVLEIDRQKMTQIMGLSATAEGAITP